LRAITFLLMLLPQFKYHAIFAMDDCMKLILNHGKKRQGEVHSPGKFPPYLCIKLVKGTSMGVRSVFK